MLPIIAGAASSLMGGGSLTDSFSSALDSMDSVMDSLGLGNAFGGTIGQVLSDGLGCWGSSIPPSEAKQIIKTTHAPYLQKLSADIEAAPNSIARQAAINIMIKHVYIMQDHYTWLPKSQSWDSCSKSGIKLFLDVANTAKGAVDEMISALTSQGAAKVMQSVSPVRLMMPKSITGAADLEIGKSRPANASVSFPVINLASITAAAVTPTIGVVQAAVAAVQQTAAQPVITGSQAVAPTQNPKVSSVMQNVKANASFTSGMEQPDGTKPDAPASGGVPWWVYAGAALMFGM